MNNADKSSNHFKNQRNSEDILADILQTSEFSHYKPSGKKDGNQIYRNKLDEDGSRDDNPGKVLSVTGLYDHTNGTHEALYSIAKRLGVPIHTDQPVKKKATVEAVSDTTAAAKKATGYQKAMDRYSTPLDDFSFQFIKKYYNSRMIPIDRDMAEAIGIRFENTKKNGNTIFIPCRDVHGKNVRSYFRVLSDDFTKLADKSGKLNNHGKEGLPASAIVISGNPEEIVIFEGQENALTYYYLVGGANGETIIACCSEGNIPKMAEFCKGATSVKVMLDGDLPTGETYPCYTAPSVQRALQLRRALPEGVCTLWLPERAKEDINDAHCKGEVQRWLDTLQQFKDETVIDYLLPMLSHLDCARKFIETYQGEFLFDVRSGNKSYMIRDNNWTNEKPERTGGVVTNVIPADSIMSAKLAIFLEQVALSNGYDEKQQREIKSSQYRSAVKRQIEAISNEYKLDRGVWNMNPNLIGTPGKTIDMHTGETYPARGKDLITQQVTAEPRRKDGALWDRCIEQWTGGDEELARYLQKCMGVWLYGERLEDLIFFIWGGTGTGKGTFIESVEHAFGDYLRRCNLDLFMESQDDTKRGPRPDIIALEGAHLVICDETQEGQAFNNSVIKALTGNRFLVARQMHNENIRKILITFSVVIVGNSQPVIKDLDPAMERRPIVIPFVCRYHGTANENQNLREQLRAPDEVAHIIQYSIDGYKMYNDDKEAFGKGLIMPKVVSEATKEYLENQEDGDLEGWINDRCELGKQFSSRPGDLALSYSCYIGREVTANALTRKLKRYNDKFKIEYKRKRWEGIAVRGAD